MTKSDTKGETTMKKETITISRQDYIELISKPEINQLSDKLSPGDFVYVPEKNYFNQTYLKIGIVYKVTFTILHNHRKVNVIFPNVYGEIVKKSFLCELK